MNSIDKELQVRATFKDVKKAQSKLRNKLNELIQENRPISDDKEREEFIDLLSNSTLGLGTIECTFWFNDGKRIKVDNLEKLICDITDWNSNVVDTDFFFFSLGNCDNHKVSISEMWRNIKSKLHGVFAEAKATSMRISKEQTHLGVSPPGAV